MTRKGLAPMLVGGAACAICCLPLIVVTGAAVAGFATAFALPLVGATLVAISIALLVLRRRQLARSCGCASGDSCSHGSRSNATRIDVLHFAGCPNGQPAIDLARRVASEHGPGVEVMEILVTEADVERQRFLGSPSIRVNGRDVDPSAHSRTEFHYGCRIYETRAGRSGLPVDDWIRTAIQESRGPRPWLTLGRRCGCDPSCWCRSGWRRRLRWVWPARHVGG